MRFINNAGIEIVKKFEGCKLEAYLCPANRLTIGYGHTYAVKVGDKITQEQAEELLKKDLESTCKRLDYYLDEENLKLNENQFSALVSFCYNLGIHTFQYSTLAKYLILGDLGAAANEFDRWVNAGRKPLPGLIKRRAEEKALFLRPIEAIISDSN